MYLISDWLICDEEVDEDGYEGEGDEESPAKLPVDAGRDVHHELDVPVQSTHRYPSSKTRFLYSHREKTMSSFSFFR